MANEAMSYYYYFDGDLIGEKITSLLVKGMAQEARDCSSEFNSAMMNCIDLLSAKGAHLVFQGGDTLVFQSKLKIDPKIIKIDFIQYTFSVGIGSSIKQAMAALHIAKIKGRATIEDFCDEG